MEFYLVWYDDDRRKATGLKIQEAMAAYERKFRKHPNVVLISEQDRDEAATDVRLRHFRIFGRSISTWASKTPRSPQ